MDDLKDLRGAAVREVHRDDAVIITGAEYLSLRHRVLFGSPRRMSAPLHGDPGCKCDADGEHPECPHHGYEAVIARLTEENERLRAACVVEFDEWLDCKLCEAFAAPEEFKHKPGCILDD